MHGNGLTVLAWVGVAALAGVTWRLWLAALRQWRYARRVEHRRLRVREDVCWELFRRQEYLQALKIGLANGDLDAAAELFAESVRHATRHYPRLAAALEESR